MEYIALNNWKELKKQKKYKEAAYALYEEVAHNLLRVHNKYSNIYLDENKYFEILDCSFLTTIKNSKQNYIQDMEIYDEIARIIHGAITCYEESEYEKDFEYSDRELLKDIEKQYKRILKLLKKMER